LNLIAPAPAPAVNNGPAQRIKKKIRLKRPKMSAKIFHDYISPILVFVNFYLTEFMCVAKIIG
jgi:hypothetical protein